MPLEPDKPYTLSDGTVFTILTDRDSATDSPRNYDGNIGTMVCFHSRYNLGDEHEYRKQSFDSWEELKQEIRKDHRPLVILNLYLFDHSGLAISTSPFLCPWDSGQVGFIYATRELVEKNWGWELPKKLGSADRVRIVRELNEEVKLYDQWQYGDTWGYSLKTPANNVLDSCFGFFGLDLETNGMLDHLPNKYHAELRAL